MPVSLPDLPARIKRLPRDERGYPVPYFVEWLKGGEPAPRGALGAEPDFRVVSGAFRARAFRQGLCWLCGDQLGVHKVYVIGPMCVINRTTSEPACHRDCAEFAARACPFMVRPRQKRNEKGLPEEVMIAGVGLKRNPGACCLYETPLAHAFADGNGSWLIRLEPPVRVDWRAEGRPATREEVLASIDSGYPLLLEPARAQGAAALAELISLRAAAMRLLPAA
jgi:hypothetical protein